MARFLCLVLLALASPPAVQQTTARQTLYVTATASDGSTLDGLSAGDVLVKEGGRPRRVLQVEPSRSKVQVALVVEELLTPDNEVRRSLANFIDHLRDSGELALYVVGRRAERRVDYTSNVITFAKPINRFAARSVERGDIVQALHEIAREQRPREGRRALVAVAVEGAQTSSVTAEAVLQQLIPAHSVLYAATIAGFETTTAPAGSTSGGRRLDLEAQVSGLERDRLFSDGTRQSGGLHLTSPRTAGLWTVLERVAAELRHQYVVSYDADSRSDGSVTIEGARPGIVVRGPTRTR